jgi:hypothetical protein
MARTYADPTYGGRHTISLPINIGLTTFASSATAVAHQFMYPGKIVDANINIVSAVEGDMGTSTSMLLGLSTDAGTGFTAFCTTDLYSELATCTFATSETVAYAPTEATFSAGDEVHFRIEGTVGEIMTNIIINLEVQELFEVADT